MAEGKKTFIFYSDWINMVREMPDLDAGILLKHILKYVNDENPTTENLLVKIAFGHMKPMLKSDLQKWDEIREKRKKAGAKGGKANAKQEEANAKQVEAVNDNVNVNVNVNDNLKPNGVDEKKSSLNKKIIEVFFSYYKNEKGIKYEFQNAKDGSAIKSLIEKIKRQYKDKHNRPATEDEIINSFDWLIRNVNEWVYNNLTIANVNSQFNQIIDFAKNGNKKKTKSRLSAEQLQNIIDGNI